MEFMYQIEKNLQIMIIFMTNQQVQIEQKYILSQNINPYTLMIKSLETQNLSQISYPNKNQFSTYENSKPTSISLKNIGPKKISSIEKSNRNLSLQKQTINKANEQNKTWDNNFVGLIFQNCLKKQIQQFNADVKHDVISLCGRKKPKTRHQHSQDRNSCNSNRKNSKNIKIGNVAQKYHNKTKSQPKPTKLGYFYQQNNQMKPHSVAFIKSSVQMPQNTNNDGKRTQRKKSPNIFICSNLSSSNMSDLRKKIGSDLDKTRKPNYLNINKLSAQYNKPNDLMIPSRYSATSTIINPINYNEATLPKKTKILQNHQIKPKDQIMTFGKIPSIQSQAQIHYYEKQFITNNNSIYESTLLKNNKKQYINDNTTQSNKNNKRQFNKDNKRQFHSIFQSKRIHSFNKRQQGMKNALMSQFFYNDQCQQQQQTDAYKSIESVLSNDQIQQMLKKLCNDLKTTGPILQYYPQQEHKQPQQKHKYHQQKHQQMPNTKHQMLPKFEQQMLPKFQYKEQEKYDSQMLPKSSYQKLPKFKQVQQNLTSLNLIQQIGPLQKPVHAQNGLFSFKDINFPYEKCLQQSFTIRTSTQPKITHFEVQSSLQSPLRSQRRSIQIQKRKDRLKNLNQGANTIVTKYQHNSSDKKSLEQEESFIVFQCSKDLRTTFTKEKTPYQHHARHNGSIGYQLATSQIQNQEHKIINQKGQAIDLDDNFQYLPFNSTHFNSSRLAKKSYSIHGQQENTNIEFF